MCGCILLNIFNRLLLRRVFFCIFINDRPLSYGGKLNTYWQKVQNVIHLELLYLPHNVGVYIGFTLIICIDLKTIDAGMRLKRAFWNVIHGANCNATDTCHGNATFLGCVIKHITERSCYVICFKSPK